MVIRVVLFVVAEQAVYSYASDTVDMFTHKPPSTHPQDSSYEMPDVKSVRGLMLGLQNKGSAGSMYEVPDSICVDEFMASVNKDANDGGDTYEEPVSINRMMRPNDCSKGTLRY